MFDLYKIDAYGVHYPSREAVQDRIAKSIAMDADGKIAAALIAMGWTPPHDGLGPRGASDEADIVNVLRAHKGAWQFRDGDWTRGSMAPDIAADEIMRLRTVFRANMLRHVTGATHAEIDAVLFPQPPEQPDAVSND